MKKLIIGMLVFCSLTAFAGSKDYCQVLVDSNGVARLTNVIDQSIHTEDGKIYEGIEGNCLDLVKEVANDPNAPKIKEINLKYIID
jgi:hypothetical protein